MSRLPPACNLSHQQREESPPTAKRPASTLNLCIRCGRRPIAQSRYSDIAVCWECDQYLWWLEQSADHHLMLDVGLQQLADVRRPRSPLLRQTRSATPPPLSSCLWGFPDMSSDDSDDSDGPISRRARRLAFFMANKRAAKAVQLSCSPPPLLSSSGGSIVDGIGDDSAEPHRAPFFEPQHVASPASLRPQSPAAARRTAPTLQLTTQRRGTPSSFDFAIQVCSLAKPPCTLAAAP
jgi:hypothetical protein